MKLSGSASLCFAASIGLVTAYPSPPQHRRALVIDPSNPSAGGTIVPDIPRVPRIGRVGPVTGNAAMVMQATPAAIPQEEAPVISSPAQMQPAPFPQSASQQQAPPAVPVAVGTNTLDTLQQLNQMTAQQGMAGLEQYHEMQQLQRRDHEHAQQLQLLHSQMQSQQMQQIQQMQQEEALAAHQGHAMSSKKVF